MNTKEEIKKLLIKSPHLRDSDPKLIATYWFNELKKKDVNLYNITGYELLKLFADSKLTNTESIRRMRQKVQEENEDLRGNYYKGRQTIEQDKMKAKLGYNVEMSCDIKKKDNHYPISWCFLNES
jgi:hypothetical protein